MLTGFDGKVLTAQGVDLLNYLGRLTVSGVDLLLKNIMLDTSLLSCRANLSYTSLLKAEEFSGNFRGTLTENYVLNELISQKRKPYFWRSGNTAELDFIIEDEGKVIPIEAKANLNTQAKSYRIFVQRFETQIGFKFSLKNIGVNYVSKAKTYSLPLFMVPRMKEYLIV